MKKTKTKSKKSIPKGGFANEIKNNTSAQILLSADYPKGKLLNHDEPKTKTREFL